MLAETVADTDGQTLGILKYKMVIWGSKSADKKIGLPLEVRFRENVFN